MRSREEVIREFVQFFVVVHESARCARTHWPRYAGLWPARLRRRASLRTKLLCADKLPPRNLPIL